MSDITKLLGSRRVIYSDGAKGTMLLKKAGKPGEMPDLMCITAPGEVENIHRMYIEAGSDIICTNSFRANAYNLRNSAYSTGQVISAAVEIARRAAATAPPPVATPPLVALDMGPIGQMLEPSGDLSYEQAYEMFKEAAMAGEGAGADLAVIETISDIEELKAAVTAVTDNTKLPVFVTMTFEKSGYTFMGCTPELFAQTASKLGAAAIGLNCSLEPKEMFTIAQRIRETSDLPLIIKPNAGLPDADGNYSVDALQFAQQMLQFAQLDVKIAGGCCGTTPEYIKALKQAFEMQGTASLTRR